MIGLRQELQEKLKLDPDHVTIGVETEAQILKDIENDTNLNNDEETMARNTPNSETIIAIEQSFLSTESKHQRRNTF